MKIGDYHFNKRFLSLVRNFKLDAEFALNSYAEGEFRSLRLRAGWASQIFVGAGLIIRSNDTLFSTRRARTYKLYEITTYWKLVRAYYSQDLEYNFTKTYDQAVVIPLVELLLDFNNWICM